MINITPSSHKRRILACKITCAKENSKSKAKIQTVRGFKTTEKAYMAGDIFAPSSRTRLLGKCRINDVSSMADATLHLRKYRHLIYCMYCHRSRHKNLVLRIQIRLGKSS